MRRFLRPFLGRQVWQRAFLHRLCPYTFHHVCAIIAAGMIIYPAIDLRRGRCVRLRQGLPHYETVYADDPLAMAGHWLSQGARWLHVVDLDAAFDRPSANRQAIAEIVARSPVPVQLGGGMRSLAAVDAARALGVARVVIGSAAVSQPELVQQAIERHGAAAVAVGIDSRNGLVTVHGWQTTTDLPALELALQMKALGVTCIICTDVARDGMLQGPNLPFLQRIATNSGLEVIASGGVSSLDDVRALAAIRGIQGVIIGQALYAGALTLPAAIAAAAG